MINRIFGVLFTLVALAIIILASYNFGNYESMFFGKDKTTESVVSEVMVEEDNVMDVTEEQEVIDSDTTSVDSLTMEVLPVE